MSKAKDFEEKVDEYVDVGKKIFAWVVMGAVVLVIVGFAIYSAIKIIF